jgi:hypothetical protein
VVIGNTSDTLSTVGGWIAGNATAATVFEQASPYTYIVFKVSSTYYANSTIGGTNYSNSNFVTMMNTLIAAMSSGQTIFIKSGTYTVGSTIDGATGISIIGEGAGTVLDGSTMASTDTMISYTGSQGTQVNLSGNASPMDEYVSVAAGDEASFSDGDLVLITSTATWDSNTLSQKEGEFFHVATTTSGKVYLEQASNRFGSIMGTYATASSAHLHEITPMKDFSLKNFKIKGDGATQVYGIYISYGENVNIDGIQSENVNSHAIWLTNTINSRVSNCHLDGSNQAGLGYGIDMEYACQNILIIGNSFVNCRHGVTIGGGTGAGIPRGITITGNTAEGGADDANYDAHAVGEMIVFSDNISIGGEYGFAIRAHTVTVIGNQVIGADVQGIRLQNAYFNTCLVALNSIRNCPVAIAVVSGAVNVKLIYNDLGNCATGVSDSGTGTYIVALG